MPDIYLLRHAHVDYIPPAQITAHNPLTPLGHMMAVRLAERCAGWDLQYLLVSPMRRAQETADAISARLANLPRLDMPEFAEVSIADLADLPGNHPAEDMGCWTEEQYAHGNRAMWYRMLRGWARVERLIAEHHLERIAIVSHGGPINAMLRRFLGEENPLRLRTCWFALDWTATCCLRDGPGGRWVRWINDARHIDDLRHLLPTEGL